MLCVIFIYSSRIISMIFTMFLRWYLEGRNHGDLFHVCDSPYHHGELRGFNGIEGILHDFPLTIQRFVGVPP